MDADIVAALSLSALATLPAPELEELVRGAVTLDLAQGEQHHAEGSAPRPALVVSGLMRVVIPAVDGRRITVRYARRGALFDITLLFAAAEAPGATEALTSSRLLLLQPHRVLALARQNLLIANALLRETSTRSVRFTAEVAGTFFPSTRQRIVRHLLELSTLAPAEQGVRMARVSQQDIADAVGTLREVVARILHDLRDIGLIETARGHVRLIDPERLHAEVYPDSW